MEIKLSVEEAGQLRRLEEDLWREEARFEIACMQEVLADDFFEFGRSGRVYQRNDTLLAPKMPIQAVIPLPNFKVRLLSQNVAQVTYNSQVTYVGVVYKARRSSIWSRTPVGWILRFHQGTPYDEIA